MLQIFRDNKQSGFIYIIFAAIILAFVLMFGLPSTDILSGAGGNKTIATIGSHKIDQDLMRSMRLRHFSDNSMSSDELRAVQLQVVDALSVVYVLADEAQANGLRVSEDELNDYLTNWESGNPDIRELGFIRNNKFSKANYELGLSRIQMSAKRYKEYKYNELLAKRYMTLMSSSIGVSDATLWQAYAQANNSAALEVIRLTPSAVAKTFHKLTTEEIAAAVTTHESQIKSYYDDNIATYTTPEMAKLQQILIQKDFSKLNNVGSKTVKTHQAVERFSIVRHQIIDEGIDFAQAFSEYDEAETKLENGTGPLMAIKNMAEEIKTALADKVVGDVIVAELSDRYIIAKIVERTPEIVTPLEDVKLAIAEKVLQDERVNARIETLKVSILAKANEGMSFDDILNETLYAGILDAEAVIDVAVEAPVIAEPIDVDAAIEKAVTDIYADANISESERDAAIEKAVADIVALSQAAVAADAVVPEVIDVLPTAVASQVSIPMDERISSLKLETTLSSGFIAGLGISDDIVRDILTAKAGDVLGKDYKIGNDVVFVKVVEHKAASRDSFELQKEEQRENELNSRIVSLVGVPGSLDRMYGTYGIWVNRKVQEAKADGRIKINQSYFESFAKIRDEN